MLVFAWAVAAASAEDGATVVREWLVIDPCGRSLRAALHTDEIEHQLVTGQWRAPQAGDSVRLPDGSDPRWRSAQANADGWLEDRALRGGYALATLETPQDCVRILDAGGHSALYVNGAGPRTGDAYRTGWVLAPIRLSAGVNTLLFACGRGSLRAALSDPPAEAFFNPRDATLPDLAGKLDESRLAAIPVINATESVLAGLILEAVCASSPPLRTELPALLPLSARKIAFELPAPGLIDGPSAELILRLLRADGSELHQAALSLRVCGPGDRYKRTFRSQIDGSVQYYAVTPAHPPAAAAPQALILTLHGAGVEAVGQAAAYEPKDWATIVAPTNRRPYGFDWEDWGRLDALEVLADATARFQPDPARIYLTGHSMGGHGTWQLGVTVPDLWAAIAPSAGWISFASYSNDPARESESDVGRMLARAANGCDTLALARNLRHFGVYVLHGDADDNVPVEQARRMRSRLAEDHADFAYHERAGAGHWWGNACVDWPPLMAFLRERRKPAAADVRRVEFWTFNPAVSSQLAWAELYSQQRTLAISSIALELLPDTREFRGTTDNVRCLRIDLGELARTPQPEGSGEAPAAALPAGPPLAVTLDGQSIREVPYPQGEPSLWLQREGDAWHIAQGPDARDKGARRAGPFKHAFHHRFVLVYGTRGDAAENAWALNKARFDAETFGYRGNGSVDVVADVDFDAAREPDRGVILYGNADTNARWTDLLPDSPVRISRGKIAVGERELSGDDLACLLVRPRPDSQVALVGVVGGSGLTGMRVTDRLPYFVSGVHYPDVFVCTPAMLRGEAGGVRVAGFFDPRWAIQADEFAFAE